MHRQAWGNMLGSLHHHNSDVFPGAQPDPPPAALCHSLSAISSQQQSLAPMLLPLLRELQGALRSSQHPRLQAGQHECIQPLLVGCAFLSCYNPCSLLWGLSSTLTSFFCCGAQNCTQNSR